MITIKKTTHFIPINFHCLSLYYTLRQAGKPPGNCIKPSSFRSHTRNIRIIKIISTRRVQLFKEYFSRKFGGRNDLSLYSLGFVSTCLGYAPSL